MAFANHIELLELGQHAGGAARHRNTGTQAIKNRNLEAVKVLLKYQHPLDVRNSDGRTPLGLAAAMNHEGACVLIAAALMNGRFLAKTVVALHQRATEQLEKDVLARVVEQKKAAAAGVRCGLLTYSAEDGCRRSAATWSSAIRRDTRHLSRLMPPCSRFPPCPPFRVGSGHPVQISSSGRRDRQRHE